MSKNTIGVVPLERFKETITNVLGYSIRQDDVAVVRFDNKYLPRTVSAMGPKEFIAKINTLKNDNNITPLDVAVIPQEDLANEANSTLSVEKDNVKNIGSRLNLRNKP